MNDIDRMRFESLQDSYDSLKQQLAEAKDETDTWKNIARQINTHWIPANEGLAKQLAEAQAKLAAVERELAEAKKTLEWLYRWIGHKPLSECVRKVSDTLQAMREGE